MCTFFLFSHPPVELWLMTLAAKTGSRKFGDVCHHFLRSTNTWWRVVETTNAVSIDYFCVLTERLLTTVRCNINARSRPVKLCSWEMKNDVHDKAGQWLAAGKNAVRTNWRATQNVFQTMTVLGQSSFIFLWGPHEYQWRSPEYRLASRLPYWRSINGMSTKENIPNITWSTKWPQLEV